MLTRQQIAFLHPEYLALPARPDVQRDLRGAERIGTIAFISTLMIVAIAAIVYVLMHADAIDAGRWM
jgi:hypothetical protein